MLCSRPLAFELTAPEHPSIVALEVTTLSASDGCSFEDGLFVDSPVWPAFTINLVPLAVTKLVELDLLPISRSGGVQQSVAVDLQVITA